jgi:dimethylamine/trimethylamine dehydrogenase
MGEEWRSGWHPEHVPPGDGGSVLIVGAGPAGLEAAQVLGKRGYDVALADAAAAAGGRVTRESRLPGLAEWARVRDYRLGQISRMPNVTLYLGNRLQAAEVREFGADHVLVATGARWRRDGIGRWHAQPIATLTASGVYTPDDLMDGRLPDGDVLVFDDDHYYMGPVLAQQLAAAGARVRYVTTEGRAGAWSLYTQEQERAQRALLELGVEIEVNSYLDGFDGATATLACIFSGRARRCAATAVVLVTSREPDEVLYRELVGEGVDESPDEGRDARGHGSGPRIRRIGDCQAPALIVHAVYSGHRAARELGRPALLPRRERVLVRPA